MRLRVLLAVILTVVGALRVSAQTVQADRLWLNTGPCTLNSGSGSPEGVITAGVCAMYVDTASGVWYTKWTGSGNTGWGVGHNATARVNGNFDVTGYAGEPGYVSQLTNWRIASGGAADFRYLFTDELHAKSFIADLEQALAGGQIICKSVAMLGSNFTNPATGATATLTVRDLPSAENQAAFQANDWVGLRTFSRSGLTLTIGETFGQVTSYADQVGGVQTWTFTRGTGANGGGLASSTVIATDAIVIDYGVSGNGCHEVNAIDGAAGANSPYSQTWTWTTSPIPANRAIRTRVGNLFGITAVAGEYGIIAATGFTDADQILTASNTRVLLTNIDINLYSSGVNTVKLNHAVPSFALGSAVPTAYGTGTGIWMGNDSGTYKFRVGVPSGAGMFWDGSTLTVRGTNGWAANQIRNSECRVSTDDWTSSTTSGLGTTFNRALSVDWELQGIPNTCYITVSGTPANGTTTHIFESALRPVQVSSRYEGSSYVGIHRATNAYASIQWFDSSGAFLSQDSDASACTGSTGGPSLAGYCRTGVIAVAPSSATQARLVISETHNGTEADPYLFAVRMFFAEATSTQTELTEWGPGGITEVTGGLIKTGTIIADNIAAGAITAAKISVSSLSAISANIGTITAGSISGVTVTAGSGNVTIGSDGIDISDGTGLTSRIKWSNGAYINAYSSSGVGVNVNTDYFIVTTNGETYRLDGSNFRPLLGAPDIGTSSTPFGTTYTNDLNVGGILASDLAGSGNDYVCVDPNGIFFRQNAAC